jgi:tetratricopeptide (TPR) repeat protein
VTEALAVESDRLDYARVLVEVGELFDGEEQVDVALAERPEDVVTLDLVAKIKHMRGELSAAIACWAQVYARSPQGEMALMRLASMLNLARDPERGAGEFLALGRDQLWRKPRAHLELEEVFRLYVARRPDEASAACRRLEERYRGRDAELYKMAVLARAWIAELSGDLDSACSVLEELGFERGFERDPDRARALSRAYELLGTREHLERAVNICLHLEQGLEKVTNLGRLAKLYRALGQEEEAAQYDRRFLLAFRRRMHRPSFEETVKAAARRYIPLKLLGGIRFPEVSYGDEWSSRERACALALTGEPGGAAELFQKLGEALDRKYLADLALSAGDTEGAIRLFLGTLAEDPADFRVIGWLLDHLDEEGSRPARNHFAQPGNSEAALRLLKSAVRDVPLRPRYWRQLSVIHSLRGEEEDSRRCAGRASALEEASARRTHALGRVLAASVYHFVGRAKGLVHEVWAERRPADPGRGGFLEEVLGNLTPEMTQAVRNTFLSVREYAQAKLPLQTAGLLDFNYSYKVTKEDEPSGGLSAGLPTALAFLSVFLNRAVPQDLAASGVLITDAHDVLVVGAVGEAEFKVRGAYNRNLRMVILPEANRRDLEYSPRVPRAVTEEIVRYVSDLDQAVGIVFGEDIWVR